VTVRILTGDCRDKLREADRLEREAREIEGDSDNPLRVAAANKLWTDAAKLRAEAAS
jgi:hypothetical protein